MNNFNMNDNFLGYLIMSPIINIITTLCTNMVHYLFNLIIQFMTMRVDIRANSPYYNDITNYLNNRLEESSSVLSEYELTKNNADDIHKKSSIPRSSFFLKLGTFNYIYVVPGKKSTIGYSSVSPYDYNDHPVKKSDISVYFFPKIKCLERLDGLIEKSKEHHKKKKKISIYENKGGIWQITKNINPRNMKTVYLPKRIENDIMGSIENYQNDIDFFKENGFPSRYTFLFSGKPGVGKTSTIISLASQLNMDIYFLSLSSKISDMSSIGSLMNSIKKNSILMIEDLDRSITKVNPQQNNQTMSFYGQMNEIKLSDLLNSFDGVMSPNNVLIFITANNPEKLPAVLMRPGRINKHVEFPSITQEVFDIIVNKFYGSEVDDLEKFKKENHEVLINIINKNVSIAKIMNIIVETRRLRRGIKYFLNELHIYDPSSDIGNDKNDKNDNNMIDNDNIIDDIFLLDNDINTNPNTNANTNTKPDSKTQQIIKHMSTMNRSNDSMSSFKEPIIHQNPVVEFEVRTDSCEFSSSG
jgi:DNA replication protein DnaC